jgi:hypothetical protein
VPRAQLRTPRKSAPFPDAFAGTREAGDYFSTYLTEVLSRFHRMSEAQLSHFPKLAEAEKLIREQEAASPPSHMESSSPTRYSKESFTLRKSTFRPQADP